MQTKWIGRRRMHAEAGLTMIELLFAGMIMVVGFLGLMVLIVTAIGYNNRNKMDTNATLAAQMVFEEVRSNLINGTAPPVTDCAGNSWPIGMGSTTIGTSVGAPLTGSNIDFTQTPVTNYQMYYTICTANGTTATYDVRWNIKKLTGGVSRVTVGARPKGASSDLKYFALPVTLRGIAGT
jgi:Tfp pilus assembly protein PilV